MKLWTYKEMSNEILTELDLLDETFITSDELVGYFNEALAEAESEIITLSEDYFKTKYYLPLVTGQGVYSLPDNIYSNKIRKVMYQNGQLIYEIKRFRGEHQFRAIAYADAYGASDYYRYTLVNDYVGQARLEMHPVSRETAILPPQSGSFTPAVAFYIRNCARIPKIGEFCNAEILAPSQVNTGTGVITTNSGTLSVGIPSQGQVGAQPGSITYVTGDQVQVQAAVGASLPAPLVAGTTYYAIATSPTSIKLATTLANAMLGTAITLTTQGTVYFSMKVAATTSIVLAALIDIPEFATFVKQWVRCRCMEKEGDPRLDGASQTLVQQKKQMVDTLTNAIPDDDNEIVPDLSHYEEMS